MKKILIVFSNGFHTEIDYSPKIFKDLVSSVGQDKIFETKDMAINMNSVDAVFYTQTQGEEDD